MKIGVWDIRWALSYLRFQVSTPKRSQYMRIPRFTPIEPPENFARDLVQRKKGSYEEEEEGRGDGL